MRREEHTTVRNDEQKSEQDGPFEFLGGNLALDLANTEIPVRGGKQRDLLRTPQDVESWWSYAQVHHGEVAQAVSFSSGGDDALQAIKQLRTMLRRLFGIIAEQHPLQEVDLADLNQLLKEGYPVVTLTAEGKPFPDYHVSEGGNPILFAIALAAVQLITGHDLTRLRACQNPTCTMFFYDTTKSATRHWCSVNCKERARSAVRYRRARTNTLPEPSRT